MFYAIEKMNNKQFINEFELMRKTAELKALSNISLTRELTDKEFKRIMILKEEVLK
jgi:hypothetical protein